MIPAATTLALVILLLGAVYVAALLDLRTRTGPRAGCTPGVVLAAPLAHAALRVSQQHTRTERPDALGWRLAPLLYLGLAGIGIALVPLAEGWRALDVEAGIVLWGAVEALTVAAVFMHGWSANALFPLIGAYRYAAIGLSAMLLSMFVLIGTALPAESLNVGAIVDAQREVWNVVRQPLGLPLFLILGLSVSLRGPLDYADSPDLAGGTTADVSGRALLVWHLARYAMLSAFAAIATACFLGGHLGPVLPGPVWLALKMLAVLIAMSLLARCVARISASRMLTALWVGALPLSFVGLALAGVQALR